jgi:hypothetical protein
MILGNVTVTLKVSSMISMVTVNHDDDDGVVVMTTTSLAPVRGTKEPVAPVN